MQACLSVKQVHSEKEKPNKEINKEGGMPDGQKTTPHEKADLKPVVFDPVTLDDCF